MSTLLPYGKGRHNENASAYFKIKNTNLLEHELNKKQKVNKILINTLLGMT